MEILKAGVMKMRGSFLLVALSLALLMLVLGGGMESLGADSQNTSEAVSNGTSEVASSEASKVPSSEASEVNSNADSDAASSEDSEAASKASAEAETATEDNGPKTVEVTVEGYGETLAEAKKDALHNAVNEVVGSLVDAETRARNDDVIEEILTASNGFVSSSKVQEVKKEDGFFKVTLKATVVRTVLAERLQTVLKTTKKLDGANIAGMVETQMKSEEDGAKQLAKFLVEENFPYSCLNFEVETAKVVKNADVCDLEAKATMSCDQKKFKEFSKKLVKLLDEIAVKKLATGVVTEGKKQDYSRGPYMRIDIPMDNIPEWKEQSKNLCFVNTSMMREMERTVWDVYLLSPKAAAVLDLCRKQRMQLEAKLLDKGGDLLDVKRYDNTLVIWGDSTAAHLMNGTDSDGNSFQPFFAYLKHGNAYVKNGIGYFCAQSSYSFTVKLSVPKADLGKLDRQATVMVPPITGEQFLEKVDALLKEIDSKGSSN